MKEPNSGFSFSGLVRGWQIPEDFVKGNVLVTMQGRERVFIENFKGISSYTEEEIRLVARRNRICIAGKRLKIDSYTKEEIEISGLIDTIMYV